MYRQHIQIDKKNLNKAFEALRKNGYFARQNFMCCQGCGGAAIPEEKQSKYVFYHSQDNDDLKSKGECYLAWNGDGFEIVRILNENQVKTEWDNSSDTRIKIKIV